MSRRTSQTAERAAEQASEAARVLQQRQQEARSEKAAEPVAEPEDKRPEQSYDPERMEKLRANRPHARAMEELVQSRQPAQEPKQEEAPSKPETEKASEPAAAEPASEPAAEAPKTQAEGAPTQPATVKAKVDGEEYDVPQEEVDAAGGLAAWRRDKASENRLRKAKEALEETRKVQGQVAEFLMRQAPGAGQPPKAEPTDEQYIAERIDKIRFGTPEESAAAMREVLAKGQQRIDPNALVEQATNRIRHDQAVIEFDKEFQDIASNPLLLKLTVAMRNERIPQLPKGEPVDWQKFYRTIGTEVRGVLGRQSQPAPQPDKTQGNPSQAASDKEARKASIVNLPAGSARAELPKEDKPGTPEEERKKAIAEMRKSRGLSVG